MIRRFTMELHGPYMQSCMENLSFWIDQIHSFVGPEKHSKLATLYMTILALQTVVSRKNSFIPLTKRIAKYYSNAAPGGGNIELGDIMRTFNYRFLSLRMSSIY